MATTATTETALKRALDAGDAGDAKRPAVTSDQTPAGALAAPKPKAPTIWYGCPVVLNDIGTVDATQKALDDWAAHWFPSKAKGEHKAHATVLYHGPGGAEKLRDAKLAASCAQLMSGRVRGIEMHQVPNKDGQMRAYITISFDCFDHALEHMHVRLRAAAEQIAEAKSWSRPHLGQNGEHLYVNDVNPHITVAIYDDCDAANREFGAMLEANAFLPYDKKLLTLFQLEEHYG